MGFSEHEPWILPRFPAEFFSLLRFFSGRFFLASVLTVFCVDCVDVVQCIVISAVLGRNSQNNPNGFSIHVVLRSGAEIIHFTEQLFPAL